MDLKLFPVECGCFDDGSDTVYGVVPGDINIYGDNSYNSPAARKGAAKLLYKLKEEAEDWLDTGKLIYTFRFSELVAKLFDYKDPIKVEGENILSSGLDYGAKQLITYAKTQDPVRGRFLELYYNVGPGKRVLQADAKLIADQWIDNTFYAMQNSSDFTLTQTVI